MDSESYFRGGSGKRYTFAEIADRIRNEAPHVLGKHITEQLEAVGLLKEMQGGTTPHGLPYTFAEAAESPLERVERQIRGLKAEPGFTVPRTRDAVLDSGAFGGMDYQERVDGWEELTDRDKFAELVRLDWQGVGPEDRRRLLGQEVELDRISPAMLRPFLDRDPARPRAPSPSEILDNPKAYLTPEAGNGHEHDHGQGHGR